MGRVVIAAMMVGVLFPIAARADLEKGDFAPDIDAIDWINTEGKSLSLTETRGMIVVLYFWENWQAVGPKLLPVMNRIDNSQYGRQSGVYTIGVTAADRRSVEETVKKGHIFFPIAVGSKAAAAYKITEFPRVVILDPMGEVVFSGMGDVYKELEKVFEATPPMRTHPREAEKVRKALEASREALKKGDYQDAFVQARRADDLALQDDPLKTRCQRILDLIDAIGYDRLQQGLALIQRGQFDQGVQIVSEVLDKFRLAGCAKAARRRMRILKEHYPEVQRAFDKIGREELAHNKLTAAAQKLWNRRFGEAYDALKKVEEEYSDTKAGENAKLIRGRMDANAALMQRVHDEQARRVCEERLSRARNFIELGRHDEARKVLRSIIDEFPQTRYMDEAYQLLSTLP